MGTKAYEIIMQHYHAECKCLKFLVHQKRTVYKTEAHCMKLTPSRQVNDFCFEKLYILHKNSISSRVDSLLAYNKWERERKNQFDARDTRADHLSESSFGHTRQSLYQHNTRSAKSIVYSSPSNAMNANLIIVIITFLAFLSSEFKYNNLLFSTLSLFFC